MNKCPKCGNILLDFMGKPNAPILILGEYPSYKDMKIGKPFSQEMGELLLSELSAAGISPNDCRFGNLWQHMMNDTCDVNWHIDQCAKEILHRKYVLLMGSQLTQMIFKKNVGEISGLPLTQKMFPGTLFIASPHPSTIMKSCVGEIRLAFSILADRSK